MASLSHLKLIQGPWYPHDFFYGKYLNILHVKHKLWLYSVHSNGDHLIFCKQQITFSVSMGSKLLLQFITVTWVYTYIQQQFSSNCSPFRNHALKRRIEFAICYIFNVSRLVKGLIWILVKLVHATEFECSKLNARVWKHSPHAYNHVNLVSKKSEAGKQMWGTGSQAF